jgi:hypothetical protein
MTLLSATSGGLTARVTFGRAPADEDDCDLSCSIDYAIIKKSNWMRPP